MDRTAVVGGIGLFLDIVAGLLSPRGSKAVKELFPLLREEMSD